MTIRWKACLLTAAAGALLFLGGAAISEARPNDRNCSSRIDSEVNKLERDVRKHGFFSRQAQQRRQKIQRLRQQCGFAGFFGRGWDNRRWQQQNRNRWGWDDRRGNRNRDGWFWDGRRWRRR